MDNIFYRGRKNDLQSIIGECSKSDAMQFQKKQLDKSNSLQTMWKSSGEGKAKE